MRINHSMRQDLFSWFHFLGSFNGVIYFSDRQWTTTDTLQLFTDSVGPAADVIFLVNVFILEWLDA